jgi:hypothetical protein
MFDTGHMKQGYSISPRTLSMLCGITGLALLFVALSPLVGAWVLFTGNGPGGHSAVSSRSVMIGVVFLLIAIAIMTSGLYFERLAFKIWQEPESTENPRRWVSAPQATGSVGQSGAVAGVWLSEGENVRWSWTHAQGGSYVSGYTIQCRKGSE